VLITWLQQICLQQDRKVGQLACMISSSSKLHSSVSSYSISGTSLHGFDSTVLGDRLTELQHARSSSECAQRIIAVSSSLLGSGSVVTLSHSTTSTYTRYGACNKQMKIKNVNLYSTFQAVLIGKRPHCMYRLKNPIHVLMPSLKLHSTSVTA